jgi:hypothetical protein
LNVYDRVASVCFAMALVAAACGSDGPDGSGASQAASGGQPVASSDGVVSPQMVLTEFSIDGDLTVPAGHVVVEVENQGAIPHNL